MTIKWQDVAAADTIGTRVAAIPADEPDGFKVTAAKVENGKVVKIVIMPGRAWVDGLLVYSHNENLGDTNTRIATYLQPPIQKPPADISTIGSNRDAVILEVWREAVNAFQIPEDLYEPALRGLDATERIYTGTAIRLLRLDQGDSRYSITNKIQDNTVNKGKLSVQLQDTGITNSDCPVVKGGGFTGFEHGLYRIEIAEVTNAPPMFKWSQFNGGLVGRGHFDPTDPKKIIITGNQQAIKTSGLDSFYLETIVYNIDLGHWQVTFGIPVNLNNNNELEISQNPIYGNAQDTSNQINVFFRLWNDVKLISDYINPKELIDGIILKFDDPQARLYLPRDYWTFSVRVGEVKTDLLINGEQPHGITYHRVPLAILIWNEAQNIDFHSIENCRKIFRPLTNLNSCCTFTVGDDVSIAADNFLKEADKWLKDIIRDNYGIAIATANLASEFGRLSLRWWLGEQYKKSK